jgi:hypothetical protein
MDIQQARLMPSDQGPNVNARLNTDTGAGEVAGSVAKLGGMMFGQGMQIMQAVQDAEDSVALDTLKRNRAAAYNFLQQQNALSRDPVANAARNKAFLDAWQNPDVPNQRVGRAFAHNQAEFLPQAGGQLAMQNIVLRKENAQAEFMVNRAAYLKSGDEAGFLATLAKVGSKTPDNPNGVGLFSDFENANMAKTFKTDSALYQIGEDIRSGNTISITAGLAKAEKLDRKTLSPEQEHTLDETLSAGKVDLRQAQREYYGTVLTQMEDITTSTDTAANKIKALDGMTPGITSAQQRQLMSPEGRATLDRHTIELKRRIITGEKQELQPALVQQAKKMIYDPAVADFTEAGKRKFYDYMNANPGIDDHGALTEEYLRESNKVNNGKADEKIRHGNYKAYIEHAIIDQNVLPSDADNVRSDLHALESDTKAMSAGDTSKYVGEGVAAIRIKLAAARKTKDNITAAKEAKADATKTDSIDKTIEGINNKLVTAFAKRDNYATAVADFDRLMQEQVNDEGVPEEPDKYKALWTDRQEQQRLWDEQNGLIKNFTAQIEAAKARKPAGKSVVKITSDAEFDALPSGTDFIDPEGKPRRKP